MVRWVASLRGERGVLEVEGEVGGVDEGEE
jgi:hypothetical protein